MRSELYAETSSAAAPSADVEHAPGRSLRRSLAATRVLAAQRSAQKEIEAFGVVRTAEAWAARIGISVRVLHERLRALPPEVAVSLPKSAHVDKSAEPGDPCAWTWAMLSYENDPWAQAFIDSHPSGASLEQVGEALGINKERVRQIEEAAIDKLQRLLGQDSCAADAGRSTLEIAGSLVAHIRTCADRT